MKAVAHMLGSFAVAVTILGAADGVLAEAQEIGGASKLQAASGKVESVDLFRKMLTVESRGLFAPAKTQTFIVSGETAISDRGGRQDIRLNDLPAGARVKIAYEVAGDKNIARSIVLQDPSRGARPPAHEPDQAAERAPAQEEQPAEPVAVIQ